MDKPGADIDPRLSKAIAPLQPALVQIAPSKVHASGRWQSGDSDGRERGIAIHAMLEWLSQTGDLAVDVLPTGLANTLGRAFGNPQLQQWWQEALRTYRNPEFAQLFDPQHYRQALNEAPVRIWKVVN